MNSTQKDFYRVLGVTHNAEMVVIKAAYKALMMVYHPDRYEGDTEEAIKKTKEIKLKPRYKRSIRYLCKAY